MANTLINPLYPRPHIAAGASGVASGIQLSVGGTTSFVAANFDTNCQLVFFDVQTTNVYVTFDGATPSSSKGNILASGTNYTWQLATVLAAKFAPVTTTSTLYAHQFSM